MRGKAIHVPLLIFCLISGVASAAENPPIFDGHIHYNDDVWAAISPQAALKILDQANVTRALVSSTPNEGTRNLHALAPHRVIAEIRPYRTQADRSGWFNDPEIVKFVEDELKRGIYRAIGEFHLHGNQAQTPPVKRLVELAVARDLPLHAHSDERAVEGLYAHHVKARVIWAHAGMSSAPETVGRLLEKYPTLIAELSYRYDIAPGGKLDPAWRALFLRHGDRFILGTDTWTPSRWNELPQMMRTVRGWLAQLPAEVAENIAYRNAERLFPAR